MSAQIGGAVEVYHEAAARRSIYSSNTPATGMSDEEMRATLVRLSGGKWMRRSLSYRGRLFRELAFCRMKLQRARARRSGYGETWVAFYRDECERLRRCIDAKSRETGKIVFPEIRAEVKSWLILDERKQMPW